MYKLYLFSVELAKKIINNCRRYRKKLYLCIPLEKRANIADVAQLARARDL